MNTQRERRPDQFRRILLPSRDDAPVVPVEAPLAGPVVVVREPVRSAAIRERTTLSYIQRPLRRRDAATAND